MAELYKTRCKLADHIDRVRNDKFIPAYIIYQSEQAHDELGDVIDESPNGIRQCIEDMPGARIIDDYLDRAETVVECLQNRYLGNCAARGCVGKELVDTLIESTQQLAL